MTPADPRPDDDDGGDVADDERLLDAVRHPRPDPTDPPDIAAARRLGAVARAIEPDDLALDDPPPDVWNAIASRSDGSSSTDVPGSTGGADVPGSAGGAGRGSASRIGGGPDPLPDLSTSSGPPTPTESPAVRLRRLDQRVVLAAAAAVVVVVGLLALVLLPGSDDDAGEPRVVASARLEPLTEVPEGSAEVVERDDIVELDLRVDQAAMPPVEGYYEVWLIDRDIAEMVSLGQLSPEGAYEIPPGVDVERFPVVDVSAEPDDGDPTHSGASVLRGTLTTES